jgi:hypothetical protein
MAIGFSGATRPNPTQQMYIAIYLRPTNCVKYSLKNAVSPVGKGMQACSLLHKGCFAYVIIT